MTLQGIQLEELTDTELKELDRALRPRLNNFTTIDPHPKQRVFLLLDDVLEVLFGGAAGPGKSTGLLCAAAQYVDVPGYSALLLRRTFKQLSQPGALMAKAQEWWGGTGAKWNKEEKQWTFPSGATIKFGYLEHDKDLDNYQSAEYQFIGFDELTQFPKHHYTYMFSRLRRLEGSQIPVRMRAATNPGGQGHSWVKDRWNLPDGPRDHPTRAFVPAFLPDNPSLDAATYEMALEELGETSYAQLRHGDWGAQASGGRFDLDNLIIIQPHEVPSAGVSIRYWDTAASDVTDEYPDPDWSAGLRLTRSPHCPDWMKMEIMKRDQGGHGPFFYIEDVSRLRATSGPVLKRMQTVARHDGLSIPIWIEQERGASGKNLISLIRNDYLEGHIVRGHLPKGSKEVRARTVSARIDEGRMVVVDGEFTESFIMELGTFGLDGVHDDQVDALSGAYEASLKEAVMAEQQKAEAH